MNTAVAPSDSTLNAIAAALDHPPHTHPSRVLLAAYQCGPGMGSVSQIGWEWFSRLAQRRPVTLVTHIRNQAAIESAGPLPAWADILYIDTEWFAGPLYKLAQRLFPNSEHGVFMIASLDFFVFDWLALRKIKQRIEQNKAMEHYFSLIHIVTPVTLAAPSRLHRLGLPVIRGPLNCGLHSPPGFEEILRHEKPWMIRLRELPRLLDGIFGATRHTQRLLTATAAARSAIPARYQQRCVDMVENGVDLTRFTVTPWPLAPSASTQTPLRVLFVGRMIALKGVNLLLHAVAGLHSAGRNVELHLLGDGPQRQEWQAMAQSLGLADVARFHGAVNASTVAQHMQTCHVLCLPSVRESGGAVLLEAMACGRPVIAVAHGGPAEIVNERNGMALPPTSPQGVTQALQAALQDIIDHPSAWAQRGQQGRAEIEERYEWEQKITAAEALYAEIERHQDPQT
jgi:glycosyltransferase involved in cell wall biosynthesis